MLSVKKMTEKYEKNYLDLIPLHSGKLTFEKDESGRVTVVVENKGFFNSILQKIAQKPRFTRIDLQGQGSFVWLCIDGKRTVFEIAEEVRKKFGEEAEPLYDRLVTYIRTLESCGFICLPRMGSNSVVKVHYR
ncbi:MAG: PqqD family protein, partial [Oscillospiraceae bacterium]